MRAATSKPCERRASGCEFACSAWRPIAADVSPELARATIELIVVLGALHAPADVKAALADRIG